MKAASYQPDISRRTLCLPFLKAFDYADNLDGEGQGSARKEARMQCVESA